MVETDDLEGKQFDAAWAICSEERQKAVVKFCIEQSLEQLAEINFPLPGKPKPQKANAAKKVKKKRKVSKRDPITVHGVTKPSHKQMAAHFGISYQTAIARKRRGLSLEDIYPSDIARPVETIRRENTAVTH